METVYQQEIPSLAAVPGDPEPEWAYLQFAVGARSQVHLHSTAPRAHDFGRPPVEVPFQVLPINPDWLGVLIDSHGVPPSTIRRNVPLRFEGSTPNLIRIVSDQGGYRLIHWPVRRRGKLVDWRIEVSDREITKLLYGAEEYLTATTRALRDGCQRVQRYRRFFFEVDQATHPNFGRDHVKSANSVFSMLTVSMQARQNALKKESRRVGMPIRRDTKFDQAMDDIVRLLNTLMDQYLDGGSDIADAMEMFANGDLRLQIPSGEWTVEPDEGTYFYFGEAALLACEYGFVTGYDSLKWAAFANAAVRGQEIFAGLYRDHTRTPGFCNSFNAHSFDERCRFSTKDKELLRKRYEDCIKPEQLAIQAASNVRRWLWRQFTGRS